MRISDWSSDVCSSDLSLADVGAALLLDDLDELAFQPPMGSRIGELQDLAHPVIETLRAAIEQHQRGVAGHELEVMGVRPRSGERQPLARHGHEDNLAKSEEHTSEPQSLMRNSYVD